MQLVYAEGTMMKRKQIELRPNVSPKKFECVNKINETNILRDIRDTEGNLEDLIQILKSKHVGILNTGLGAINAYDFLLKSRVNICCFISGTDCECKKYLFTTKTTHNFWKFM